MSFIKLNNGNSVESNGDMLLKLLVDATRKVGHKLSYSEAAKISELPERPNSYAYFFGSFSEAADSAWRVVKREKAETEKEKAPAVEEPKKEQEVKMEVKEMGRLFNREETLRDLKRYYEEHENNFPKRSTLNMGGLEHQGYPGIRSLATMERWLGPMEGWFGLIYPDGAREEAKEAKDADKTKDADKRTEVKKDTVAKVKIDDATLNFNVSSIAFGATMDLANKITEMGVKSAKVEVIITTNKPISATLEF